MKRHLLGPVLVFLLVLATPARGQRIEGRVVSAADSAPVVSALVSLRDGRGVEVGRTTTEPSGAFRFDAPAPGAYLLTILRIGHRPWRSERLDVRAGGARALTLAIPDDPIVLEAIAVEARSRCRSAPAEGSVVALLLAEADKALTVTRMVLEHGDVGFAVERYQRTLSLALGTVDSTGQFDPVPSWPIQSVPAESLAVHGFVREDYGPDSRHAGYSWFGVDAALLLSPWFLSTHCFGVALGTGPDSGTVSVTFRPSGGHRPDIEGAIVIARGTLALRRIEWRFVRLGWRVPAVGAGGAMELEHLPSGVYVPARWWQRAPVPEVSARGEPLRILRWEEMGGRIVPDR